MNYFSFYSRKIHRYLGIFIGIQFLFWTLGGLYFSWTNIKEIRGDHLRKEEIGISSAENLVSPNIAMERVKQIHAISSLHKLQLIEVMQKPYYEILVSDEKGNHKTFLADAQTGILRQNITQNEAEKIAVNAINTDATVKNTEYLSEENMTGHHEYREKPLPAFAVTFNQSENLTVYVSASTGRVETLRTNSWRIFDFLWMFHTMDFKQRDNINNYLLRGFSVLGILTILSGFTLFFISSPMLRRKIRKVYGKD